jgi:ABC-type glycerol-3-phosphate transport system substrate-binding protein
MRHRRFSTTLSAGFLGLSLLFLSGCGEIQPTPYKVTLEVWGTFDDSDVFSQIVGEYRKNNPYIQDIIYRKLSPETYKEDLLDAMAAGTGPDIFMMRNTWLSGFQDKVMPAPDAMLTEKMFRDAFVDVVADDFLSEDKRIYAVPLSVDSLALYYNKDLFNAVGITAPPATWEELVTLVPRLTRIDQFGNINQSGIALGTAENVNRSPDLLLTLMLQSGAEITDGRFTDQEEERALNFYTQFARLGGPTYTWNQRQHYSIDAFYEGTLGMMINYSYHYQTIRQKNAKFNFGVAPLPQFKDKTPMNLANYWGFAVTKNKEYKPDPTGSGPKLTPDNYQKARLHESWQFLKYLTMPNPSKTLTLTNALSGTSAPFPITMDPAAKYVEITMKPAARRDLIEKQKGDVFFDPFVGGNLIAESWKPENTEEAERYLADTISAVVRGERATRDALTVLENRLRQLERRR